MSIREFLARKTKKATATFWWGMGGTLLTGLILFGFGIGLSWRDCALTIVIAGTGWVIGVLLGIFVSPHKGEGALFRLIGSYVMTFLTGFVVSKLAGINLMNIISNIASDNLKSGRALLFLSFFLLGVMQTYFIRVYLDPERPQDDIAASKSENLVR